VAFEIKVVFPAPVTPITAINTSPRVPPPPAMVLEVMGLMCLAEESQEASNLGTGLGEGYGRG